MRFVVACVVLACVSSASLAEISETRIPLNDGKISTSSLSSALLHKLHLPAVDFGGVSVDLSSYRGGLFLKALNTSLGEGCHVELEPKELVIRVDSAKLPRNRDAIRQTIRIFTATAAPEATAAQRANYGLHLPTDLKPDQPIVVLLHGLDCNGANFGNMPELLRGQGLQVATFVYPSDGPLADSVALLTRDMTALRECFPQLSVNVVGFSMGGLVARGYVESDQFAGGVDRLILLGAPNLGSDWTGYRWILEAKEHWGLWRNDKDWSWTWMITDGLGEAGRDISGDSKYLKNINGHSRREGVRYTVIAGSQHPKDPWIAAGFDRTANLIPTRAVGWWGFRQTSAYLRAKADRARHHTGDCDGPVNVSSACLAGVADQIILPADHYSLFYGDTPASWEAVRARLAE